MLYIGIDPGKHTGYAVWDSKKQKLIDLRTLHLHQALNAVITEHLTNEVVVVFEDARMRKWFGEGTQAEIMAKSQGAGSVKRDCTIWEEMLEDYGIAYIKLAPQKGMTKKSAEDFKLDTGWQGKTSNHARDAAMLVLGR